MRTQIQSHLYTCSVFTNTHTHVHTHARTNQTNTHSYSHNHNHTLSHSHTHTLARTLSITHSHACSRAYLRIHLLMLTCTPRHARAILKVMQSSRCVCCSGACCGPRSAPHATYGAARHAAAAAWPVNALPKAYFNAESRFTNFTPSSHRCELWWFWWW
jgi:hypothetical protein